MFKHEDKQYNAVDKISYESLAPIFVQQIGCYDDNNSEEHPGKFKEAVFLCKQIISIKFRTNKTNFYINRNGDHHNKPYNYYSNSKDCKDLLLKLSLVIDI